MAVIYSLPYYPLRVTSPYGYRIINVLGATSWHSGIDLGADKSKYSGNIDGGNILAVADGVVCNSYFNSSRGWVVIMDHGNEFKTLYQHLMTKGAPEGARIQAGDPIGRMGNTGASSGVHLHFEIILNKKQVDPFPYLLNVKKRSDQEMGNIYQKIEDVPKWHRTATQTMIDLGGITPAADGSINISDDLCRAYTSLEKIGLLGALKLLKEERG